MKTVFWKELREHARWLPLGLIPMLVTLVYVWNTSQVIFDHGSSLPFFIGLIGSCVAAGLGLLQSWPDDRSAARALLLHRGITHNAAFWGKLLAGLFLYTTVTVLPLVCLSVFIAIVGRERLAAYPDVILPSLFVSLAAFTFWPAAQLVIRRDARVFGSRFLPCVTAAVALLCSGSLITNQAQTMGVAISILLPLAFLAAARSTFIHSDGQATRVGRAALAGIIIVSLFAGMLSLVPIVEEFRRGPYSYANYRYYTVRFGPDGNCWLTSSKYDLTTYTYKTDQIAKMTTMGSVREQLQPMPDGWQSLTTWTASKTPVPSYSNWTPMGNPFFSIGTALVPGAGVNAGRHWVFDARRGELLVYRTNETRHPAPRLESRLHPGDDQTDDATSTRRFGRLVYPWSPWAMVHPTGTIVVMTEGVYVVPSDGSSVELLYAIPSDAKLVGLHASTPEATQPFELDLMLRYVDRVVWLSNRQDADAFPAESMRKSKTIGTFRVTEAMLPLELAEASQIHVARVPSEDDAFYGLADPSVNSDILTWYRFARSGEVQSRKTFREDTAADTTENQTWIASLIPPGFPLAGFMIQALTADDTRWVEMWIHEARTQPTTSAVIAALVLFQGIMGAAVAVWATRRRRLDKRSVWRWLWVGIFLGPAGSLAVLAVYPRIVYDTCDHCQQATRVDRLDCEACGQPFGERANLGIEIFDDAAPAWS